MAKIPTAENLQKKLPSYSGAVANIPTGDATAVALQRGGDMLRNRSLNFAENTLRQQQAEEKEKQRQEISRQNEIKKLNIAQAKSNYKLRLENTFNELDDEEDYTQYPKIFQNKVSQFEGDIKSGFKNDPIGGEYFNIYTQEERAKYSQKLRQKIERKQADNSLAALTTIEENAKNLFSRTGSFEDKEDFYTALQASKKAGFISAEDAEEKRLKFEKETNKAYLESLTAQDRLSVIGNASMSSFDDIIEYTLKQEGGYVARDGTSNAPANFGINQKANPDIDVKNLTKDGAKKIYQARYWDAISADSLPPEMRLIAFESAVNQGVGWTKKALQQSGGDADKFYNLRRQRYIDIAENNPEQKKHLAGWLARLERTASASLQQTNENEYTASIPADELRSMSDKTLKEIEADQKQAEELQHEENYARVIAGELSGDDIDNLFLNGAINSKRYKTLQSAFEKKNKEQAKAIESEQKISAMYSAPVGSSAHKSGADELYKTKVIPTLANPELDLPQKLFIFDQALTASKGYVPAEMKNVLSSMMLSSLNNPEDQNGQFVGEYVSMAKLSDYENSYYGLDEKLQRYGTLYSNYKEMGYNPTESANMARSIIVNSPKQDQIKKEMTQGDEAKYLKTINFRDEAWANPFMDTLNEIEEGTDTFYQVNGDFKAKYEAYRMTGMEPEEAKQSAFEYLEKNYGVMPTGNFSKYAFSQDKHDFVTQEIESLLNQVAPEIIGTDYTLQADSFSDKQAKRGDPITYQILREDGLPLLDKKTGNRIVYSFDDTAYEQFKLEEQAVLRKEKNTSIALLARMRNVPEEVIVKELESQQNTLQNLFRRVKKIEYGVE